MKSGGRGSCFKTELREDGDGVLGWWDFASQRLHDSLAQVALFLGEVDFWARLIRPFVGQFGWYLNLDTLNQIGGSQDGACGFEMIWNRQDIGEQHSGSIGEFEVVHRWESALAGGVLLEQGLNVSSEGEALGVRQLTARGFDGEGRCPNVV